PVTALDLIWRFLDLAGPTYERADDSNGRIGDVFADALGDLETILPAAKPDPETLATEVFTRAIEGNDYGEYDGLINLAAPTLGATGLAQLKAEVEQALKSPGERPAEDAGEIIGWGSGGAVHRDRMEYDHRQRALQSALLEIADAEGDPDAFIATLAVEERRSIHGAVAIATRLVLAGRAQEALDFLDAADDGPEHLLPDLIDARISALDALGRDVEAQKLRWHAFEKVLDIGHLRTYLKKLPDFDDMEAEERAMDYVATTADPHDALIFFINWPSFERAGQLVRSNPNAWDGNFYEILRPAADALETKEPLAATILRREMILFTLEAARSKRYKHAARHLRECESLARSIEEFGPVPDHEAFLDKLHREHPRKSGFWSLVD
ncbi:MAG: DUF6880 family protein, partial [Pseudomonadota bacterium]